MYELLGRFAFFAQFEECPLASGRDGDIYNELFHLADGVRLGWRARVVLPVGSLLVRSVCCGIDGGRDSHQQR